MADPSSNSYRKDATAGYSKELTEAATKVWPLFAQVSTVAEWVSTLSGDAIGGEDIGDQVNKWQVLFHSNCILYSNAVRGEGFGHRLRQ